MTQGSAPEMSTVLTVLTDCPDLVFESLFLRVAILRRATMDSHPVLLATTKEASSQVTQICKKHFPPMRIIHNDPDAGQVAINSSKCSSNSNSRVGEMQGPKASSILTGVLAEFILWSKLPKELFFFPFFSY